MYTESHRAKTAGRLYGLRNEKGLSPAELAKDMKAKYGESIHVSKESILKWETLNPYSTKAKAGYGMRIDTLCYFADYFDTTVNYLLGIEDYKEKKTLGLTDKAIKVLTWIPCNIAIQSPVNFKTIRVRRRGVVNGRPGTEIIEEQCPTVYETLAELDNTPRLYIKCLNAILEKHPSILSTICTVLFADKGLSRRDPVDRFTVDGCDYHPAAPGGDKTINAHLDELCDEILYLRQKLQEEEERKEK